MATADDAKRAVREKLDDLVIATAVVGITDVVGRDGKTPRGRFVDARDALLRAADAMIDGLCAIEALPTHGRARRYTDMARDALARVAAMGDGRDGPR